MIYVCVVAHNNAPTVGLVLWKVRKVLSEHKWEYHFLVADDGSTDETPERLDLYQRALPMTVLRDEARSGYATSMERLLRDAVNRSDRPKRDAAATLPADFGVSPAVLPDLVKRFASGADLVVGETLGGARPIGERIIQRWAPWLLRPGLNVPGLRDVTSGVCLVRLSTLQHCFRQQSSPLLETEGWCAKAELVARAAVRARQIAAVPLSQEVPFGSRAEPIRAWTTALALYRAGRRLRIPAPDTPVQRV